MSQTPARIILLDEKKVEPAGGLLVPKYVIEEREREAREKYESTPRPFTDGTTIRWYTAPAGRFLPLPECELEIKNLIYRAFLYYQNMVHWMHPIMRVVAGIVGVPKTYKEMRIVEVLR